MFYIICYFQSYRFLNKKYTCVVILNNNRSIVSVSVFIISFHFLFLFFRKQLSNLFFVFICFFTNTKVSQQHTIMGVKHILFLLKAVVFKTVVLSKGFKRDPGFGVESPICFGLIKTMSVCFLKYLFLLAVLPVRFI